MTSSKSCLMGVLLVIAAVQFYSRVTHTVRRWCPITRWDRRASRRRLLFGHRPVLTRCVTRLLAGGVGRHGEGDGCVDATASFTRTSATLPRAHAGLAGRRVELLGNRREGDDRSGSDDRGAGGAR